MIKIYIDIDSWVSFGMGALCLVILLYIMDSFVSWKYKLNRWLRERKAALEAKLKEDARQEP